MDTEQIRSGHTLYLYLVINDADQDLDRRPEPEKREWEHRLIKRTNSLEWGSGERATFRAGLEPTSSVVYIVTSPFGKRIWLISCDAPDITAGGLEIHLFPAGYPLTERLIPTAAAQSILAQTLVEGQINPRKFLTAQDLDSLRILFPKSIGAQLLIAGFLRVLFNSGTDAEQARNLSCPSELGGLVVLLDTAKFNVTAQNVHSGAAVSDREAKSVGCLGLMLGLPGGKTNALYRVLYPHWEQDTRTNDLPRQSQSNNPKGKDILRFKTNTKVGTITHCFDNPSPILPFPAGYRYDLSLIEGESLPDMVRPPGYPIISASAPYGKVLASAPLYTVTLDTQTPYWREAEGAKAALPVADLVLLGSEYIWDREASDQTVAVLWRSKNDVDSAGDSFGSYGEAVVFHNYDTCLRMWESEGPSSFTNIKAGFLLPGEIRKSMIVVPGPNQPTGYNTVRRYPLGL
ncbi:hypothetical protein BDV09DRAFT_186676 [Aspergillus tetrazonus]